jgi:hypothetical protein
MRQIVGLDEAGLESSFPIVPDGAGDQSLGEIDPESLSDGHIDLEFALDLLERASQEIAEIRSQAAAHRDLNAVVDTARKQVAAAGTLISDLRDQLRRSEEKAQKLGESLENANRRLAQAELAESQLASLQLAISSDLSDGLVGTRASARLKPIAVPSSSGSHRVPQKPRWEREQ